MLRRISFVFLLLFSLSANALLFTDIKFGTKQMGDAQWSVSACQGTTTCTSSAQTVGTFRNGTGASFTLGSTQYIKFVWANTDTTKPWNIVVYNSNGTVAQNLGNFRIINAGQNYFMTTNAAYPNAGNGTLWSTQSGMVSSSKSYTETLQPTQAQMDAYANSYYSPDPIYVAGATYSPPVQYSSGITPTQQTSKNTNTTLRQAQTGNELYVDQVGDNNTITLRQGSSLTGKNRMTVNSNGSGNTLNLNQGYNQNGTTDVADSNNHYQLLSLSGNNNNVTTVQKDSGSGPGQYMENTISGNNNVVDLKQSNASGKVMFTNINGSNNTVNAQQKDGGLDYLDVKLTGNGHNVTALQQGSGNHAATIDLTNSGGSSTVNMTQQGGTAQTYSIQQSCTNPAGCSTTIVQGQ